MIFFSLVVASLPPGTLRGTFNYSTSSCPDASPPATEGACFAAFGYHPTTLCREIDANCSTNQRVAIALTSVHRSPTCTSYTWIWTCAVEERVACGPLWCDAASACEDNMTCTCVPPMSGDAVWHRCECPELWYRNGTTCNLLPDCIVWGDDDWFDPVIENSSAVDFIESTQRPTSTTTLQSDNQEKSTSEKCNDWLVECALGIVGAFGLGIGLGLWYGFFYCDKGQVHPDPTYETLNRVRQNRMYSPAYKAGVEEV